MNEPNSFCEGSCGSGVDPTTLLDTQYVAPVLTTYPEVRFKASRPLG